jgi:hypothetical protein
MRLYRPVTVLVGILFVVAGGLVRLADPNALFDDASRNLEHAGIGQRVAVDDSAVEIKRIRFARTVLKDADSGDEPTATDGVFLAVELDATRGPGEKPRLEATLRSGEGTLYRPIQQVIATAVDFPEPGFVSSSALVYEVNPADVAGLQLMLKPTTFWTVLVNDYAVDLGLPDEKTAEEHIGRSAQTYVIPKTVVRVVS